MIIFIDTLLILIFLLCAVYFILSVLQAKKANLITNGTIVSIRYKKQLLDIQKGTYIDLYFPTFKFTVDGKEYVKESESATSENIYKEGQTVKVNYNEENPMDAILLADKKGKIVVGIGLTIFTILGGLYMLLANLSKDLYSPLIFLVIGFIVLTICYFITKSHR